MGDFVDRGFYSVETFLLLLALKVGHGHFLYVSTLLWLPLFQICPIHTLLTKAIKITMLIEFIVLMHDILHKVATNMRLCESMSGEQNIGGYLLLSSLRSCMANTLLRGLYLAIGKSVLLLFMKDFQSTACSHFLLPQCFLSWLNRETLWKHT